MASSRNERRIVVRAQLVEKGGRPPSSSSTSIYRDALQIRHGWRMTWLLRELVC